MTGDGRTPLPPSHLSDARWRRLARLLARTRFGTGSGSRGRGGEEGWLPSTQTTEPAKTRVQSTVPSPVKLVWQIASDMKAKDPNVRRKDVVEACVRQGVALHTARTQYQRWFKKNQTA